MVRKVLKGLQQLAAGRAAWKVDIDHAEDLLRKDIRLLQQSVDRLADAQQTVFTRAARMERDAAQIKIAMHLNDVESKDIAALDDATLAAEIERASHSILGKVELEPGRDLSGDIICENCDDTSAPYFWFHDYFGSHSCFSHLSDATRTEMLSQINAAL